ncbi:hypothetical protein V6N12_049355 [Hibiscus sabdariffa]|uniref:Uncharacterized protein n=1 Tax=Hibiscus sabdariffa TaxID=183260 RepID=A0ABR2CB49_9ROSI
MGENASQIQNCESLSLLIATDQEEFINEVVGVEVGSELFHAEKQKKKVALKKSKAKSQEELKIEIGGRWLLNSDLKAVWFRHLKESQKTLKLRKKLGFQFIGMKKRRSPWVWDKYVIKLEKMFSFDRNMKVIFSGPIMGIVVNFAELSVVKTMLDVFDEIGRGKEVDLVVEFVS